jgi:hypothetical protein
MRVPNYMAKFPRRSQSSNTERLVGNVIASFSSFRPNSESHVGRIPGDFML